MRVPAYMCIRAFLKLEMMRLTTLKLQRSCRTAYRVRSTLDPASPTETVQLTVVACCKVTQVSCRSLRYRPHMDSHGSCLHILRVELCLLQACPGSHTAKGTSCAPRIRFSTELLLRGLRLGRDSNLGPLEEQPVILPSEWPLQPHPLLLSFRSCFIPLATSKGACTGC